MSGVLSSFLYIISVVVVVGVVFLLLLHVIRVIPYLVFCPNGISVESR